MSYTVILQSLGSITAAILTRAPARSLIAVAWLWAVCHAQTAEHGLAGFYGASFDGQLAASGEIYHQENYTAAHRTLPFGTTVRIRRTDTGASVVVLINDRGPFIGSRIVDLSNAAARELGMLESGVAPVALEVLQTVHTEMSALFAVQAGTFRTLANAERTRSLLERLYGSARIVAATPGSGSWCVLVGTASAQAAAETLAAAVRQSAKEFASAFVIKLTP